MIDGLKLQGCNPGLVVGARGDHRRGRGLRNGGADTCTLWATFARRGLGYSAVQGTTNRNDNTEAFDTHPSCLRDFQSPTPPEPALNHGGGGRPRAVAVHRRRLPRARRAATKNIAVHAPGRLHDAEDRDARADRDHAAAAAGPDRSASCAVNDSGVFLYPWKTDAAWAGTCREFVMTERTGKQYRAYYRFT